MLGSLIERVFENHNLRKLYHILGGGLGIFGLVLLNRNWFILVGVIYVLVFLFYGKRVSFAAIAILLLLILSGSEFITLLASIIWVVGDGLAGLLGAAYGRRKWPWHNRKTIFGSVSFFVSSSLAMLVLLSDSTDIPPSALLLMTLVPCFVACMVETLPASFIRDRKPDDNLMVILITGFILQLLSLWLDLEGGF